MTKLNKKICFGRLFRLEIKIFFILTMIVIITRGLLFGFDTSIILGLVNYFARMSAELAGDFIRINWMYCWFTFIIPNEYKARPQNSLIICAFLFFIGTLGSAFSPMFTQFVLVSLA